MADRSYTISGSVKPGQKKGKETGLHTANLSTRLAGKIPKGLYFCDVELEGRQFNGLLYYGYNSLSRSDCLEVHILGLSKKLYGEKITIKTKRYLRPELKFNSITELSAQIKKDLEQVKKLAI